MRSSSSSDGNLCSGVAPSPGAFKLLGGREGMLGVPESPDDDAGLSPYAELGVWVGARLLPNFPGKALLPISRVESAGRPFADEPAVLDLLASPSVGAGALSARPVSPWKASLGADDPKRDNRSGGGSEFRGGIGIGLLPAREAASTPKLDGANASPNPALAGLS